MKLSGLNQMSALGKLSLFVIVLLLLAVFLAVSFSMNEQRAESKAWLAAESAKTMCENGLAVISVQFASFEEDGARPVNVMARDMQTGSSLDLGRVDAGEVKSGDIHTQMKELDGGSVILDLSIENNSREKDQRAAVYGGIECEVESTVKPTVVSTVVPTTRIFPTWTPIPTNEEARSVN